MRLIGDIHGRLHDYKNIINSCDKSIQVGDFGIGFAGEYWHGLVNNLHKDKNHRFIRGNHDNPSKCKDMVGWIPDGTVENDIMFVGGAYSIDRDMRVPGIDWWEDEQCSYAELGHFIDMYKVCKPRIMITHDAPGYITKEMFIDTGKALGNKQIYTRTATAFDVMFEYHKPEKWYFGHWHHSVTENINGTEFTCIGICDYIDI